MNKKILLLLGIIFAFVLKAGSVFALEVEYPNILGHSVSSTSSIGEYGCYLIAVALDLAVILASIAIVWGGINYLISFGTGKFTSEAKDIIRSAVTGLLIIVCATLIAYTINPELTSCKVGVLSFLRLTPPSNTKTNPYGAPTATYKEIPIGALTETLLTRTIGCYGFDDEGNPIDGEEITTDEGDKEKGPTYLEHDRADCFLQLIDGAQKKAQVAAALSSEINKLMSQCDCEKYGDCRPKCNPAKGCQVTSACPSLGSGSCAGDCIEGECLNSAVPDCCPAEVKDKIEHGPVPISIDVGSTSGGSCKTQEKQFKGLDEFRCPSPGSPITQCSDIVDFVEKEVNVKEKKIKLINQEKWKQLNLTQQLIYFKEKIDDFKEKIRTDEYTLAGAATLLNSRQCYLAVPSVDLFRTYTTTNQKDKFILINRDGYSDPETGKKANAAKYCAGFNYNNSSCLKKCNDQCPDASSKAIEAYKKCAGKKDEDACIKNAYNQRPCTLGSNTSTTFTECLSSCQNDCSADCEKKYLPCSNDYNICKTRCDNNSECVLDNANQCLFNPQAFKTCASDKINDDQTSINNCIDNAYLCKSGSEQYAGSPDCVDETAYSSNSNCSFDKYSASYLYENPDCQKCPTSYGSAPAGGVCSGNSLSNARSKSESPDNKKKTLSCQDACPETSKCPPASSCPQCPCDEIKRQTFKFSMPNESTKDNTGNEGYVTREEKISDDFSHQIVGPDCNGYIYNDDPLTFYCQDEWWNDSNREGLNQTPIGTQRMCLPGGEVPVGQAVDNAKKWADGLVDTADKMVKNIENILVNIKKAGEAKVTNPIQNYCMCDAKFESALPICKTDCEYKQEWTEESIDGEGNITPGRWNCHCDFVACKGNPCQQVIDYLSQIWNDYRQFKQSYIAFYMVMATEPRSDIIKELTYSRSQTNKCSLVRNNYGTNSRLLSCTRAEDEVMPPIIGGDIIYNSEKVKSYCYGKNLDASLTDNWFCCENYSDQKENEPLIDENALP